MRTQVLLAATLLVAIGCMSHCAHAQKPPVPSFADRVVGNFQQELSKAQTDLFVTRANLALIAEENGRLKTDGEAAKKTAADEVAKLKAEIDTLKKEAAAAAAIPGPACIMAPESAEPVPPNVVPQQPKG